MQRVTENGKTYVIREGKRIEIVTLDTGIDAKIVKIKLKRNRRFVGYPWAYLVDICRQTRGQAPLAVAAFIYRRAHVCKSQTVTLPSAELAELGIDRSKKCRALVQLADAGFIRIEENAPGRTSKVTLLWKD
jgi:hypothetical protein